MFLNDYIVGNDIPPFLLRIRESYIKVFSLVCRLYSEPSLNLQKEHIIRITSNYFIAVSDHIGIV